MSYFTLQERPESIAKKISNAFTGGRPTVKEQQELGGMPEVCCIYEICVYQFMENDDDVIKLYHDCKSGKILCGECKDRAIKIILGFVKKHQQKRQKYIDKAREILQVA